MLRTDDPIADFMRHEDKLYEALIGLPICCCCLERIQDEEMYVFDDDFVCPECVIDYINDEHKKRTVDYIQ